MLTAAKGQQCPLCKTGVMKERKGKFGMFLGCSNYPSCAMTFNLKGEVGGSKLGHLADLMLKNAGFDPKSCI